jgi:hypothetical protein
MKFLRQSTASQEIPIGYLVDSTDGDTEETGLTISNTDILLHKHGGTTLPTKNSGGATHISNGIYYATLDDTDTNTVGNLQIFVHESGSLAWKDSYVVLPADVYDWLTGAASNLPAGSINAAAIATDALTAAKFATDSITADALASDAVNEIVDQTWTEAIADHSGTAGSTAEALNNADASNVSVVVYELEPG